MLVLLFAMMACQNAQTEHQSQIESDAPVVQQEPAVTTAAASKDAPEDAQRPQTEADRLPVGADITLVHEPVEPKDSKGVSWDGHKRTVHHSSQRDNARLLGRVFQKKVEHKPTNDKVIANEDVAD